MITEDEKLVEAYCSYTSAIGEVLGFELTEDQKIVAAVAMRDVIVTWIKESHADAGVWTLFDEQIDAAFTALGYSRQALTVKAEE